ncbi:MAG: molybdopterin-guanine dinucleotide biosynthesis protein B [Desulfuromonadaceae bacterium]|nr:molybdopterin-guanine dinucleotide biosynthesis protein B [Desulfuromonadaceae bacterium]
MPEVNAPNRSVSATVPAKVPVVAIVGWSGSGKTTLMEALIVLFKDKGLRVAALKHDAHDFSIDTEGKDSYRFTAAGADRTVICAPHKLAVVELLAQPMSLEALLERFDTDMDLVLVEGFKTQQVPKIEVYRPSLQHELMCVQPQRFPGVVALASDAPLENCPQLELPMLPLNEPERVAEFILAEFILAQFVDRSASPQQILPEGGA